MNQEVSPNTILSHYRIVSKIGAGGMGEVYLAEDTKLDRKVALKILPADVAADQTRMRRFVQEAKTASALNHPNIITIHEIEQVDSVNFIATEFIDGDTLRQRMKTDLKLADILETGIQITSALAAAHEAGIVHRDIKPENIMIRRDGYIKVLDFGIAKLTEKRHGDIETGRYGEEARTLIAESPAHPVSRSFKTDAGTVMGTAVYMSPEQAKGIQVDARTDLWSVGVVLYEMVTHHLPFIGETSTETISLILQKDHPPLTHYASELPGELERIIDKCLSKDTEGRYQSAKDLLIDLRNLKRKLEIDAEIDRTVSPELRGALSTGLTGDGRSAVPTTATGRPTSSAEYIVTEIKQHKITVAVSVILLVLAAVAVAAYLRVRKVEASIDSIAVLPFENRSSDAEADYLSDGLAESLIYRLSQLPNLRVAPSSAAFSYKGKQVDAVKTGNELGVSAVLVGRITQRGENLAISAELIDVQNNKLLWGEQYERRMSELLTTQREMAREIVDKLRLKVSGEEKALAKHYTNSNEAYQLYLKGQFYWTKRTEEGMLKSLEYYQQAIVEDPNFALAYSGMADAYILLGAPDAAGGLPPAEALTKAKTAALKALQIDDTLAEAHSSLAHAKYYNREWVETEQEYKRAIELNPNYPMARSWYAVFLMSLGRFDEALAQIKRAQELDPLSLPINMTVGWVLLTARQPEQSVQQLRKTLEMDPNFSLAHHRLGLAYEQQGKFDEAIAEFQQVVTLTARKPLGCAALARAYALAGKRTEAQKILYELQQMSQQRYVSPASVSVIYAALGDKDQAFAWLEKAQKEHDGILVRLKVDPRYDSLRSDPRFEGFVKRVGVPE